MKFKALALTAILGVAAAGLAEAGIGYFATPTPETTLALASQRLDLDPTQQARLRPLLQRAAALRTDIRSRTAAMRAASREEFERPDADLRALDRERKAQVAAELKAMDELRDQFLAFYQDTLRPDQQAKARQLIIQRMDRFDRLRERIVAMGADPSQLR